MKTNKNLLIILAAAVILISAWVYYMSQINMAVSDSEREFRAVTQQSSSDETDAIEEDLEDTDFEDIDSELLDIETELNSTTESELE